MRTNRVYDTQDLWTKDRDHFIHPWTDFSSFKEKGSMVLTESEGSHIYDSEGNRYLDGIGGLWCVNIGYGSNEIAEAIAEQARLMPYYSSFGHHTTPPAAEAVFNSLVTVIFVYSWQSPWFPDSLPLLPSLLPTSVALGWPHPSHSAGVFPTPLRQGVNEP